MKFLVQRVLNASVAIDNQTLGSIDSGFLVLAGISQDDTQEVADKMIKKLFLCFNTYSRNICKPVPVKIIICHDNVCLPSPFA